MAQLRDLFRVLWEYVKEASGENDYVRYRSGALMKRETPMTPKAFYVWRLRRKYSRISRCC
jgi:Selenoprotein, putative